MSSVKSRLNTLFENAERVRIDAKSRIVLMSDCHRGNAGNSDNFARNQNTYFHALKRYWERGFTYIELGDGDELWENRNPREIKSMYAGIFWLLARFHAEGRLKMLHGNHDKVKESPAYMARHYSSFYDERLKKTVPLFPGLTAPESLVLRHQATGGEILLIHGNQGDLLSDRLWKLGRFLVRYLWKPLELIGVNDPTLPAKNYKRREKMEKSFTGWASDEGRMLIAGHTHRPVFPAVGQPPYFNDGSCVHPRCITAIEIEDDHIALVKWHTDVRDDANLFIAREVLAGPASVAEWLSSLDGTPCM